MSMANQPNPAPLPVEVTTIRKVRIRIIPFIFILFVVAYLDRINIGFAALTMNKDLGITGQQFGLVAGIFFFGYFLFEVPSNLMLHKIGAGVWIARILITWGILATLTGFVHGVHQLYVIRFLLGLAEAGYYPGMLLYLTYWFRQREQAQSIALLLTGLPVTSILGAPLSGFILDHAHWLGLANWRWVLILEGFPAILCGVLVYFLLPSRPAEAKFLNTQEKLWLQSELQREEQQKLQQHELSAMQALAHGRVWYMACIHFGALIGLYSLSFWVPQLLKTFSGKYSNSTVGLLVMIPHVVGLVAMVLVARSSDRRMERRYHGAVSIFLAGVALLLMSATHSPFLLLVLLCFLASGVYSYLAPFMSLPSEFLTGFAAAAGLALINSIGNLSGFAGPYLIGFVSARTGSLYLGFTLAGIPLIVSAALLLLLPDKASVPLAQQQQAA
jgi:MFS transporter, ACS family, tartrate transporter